MNKPRPRKTTFVITVSPLPGKYQFSPTHRPALSRSLHPPGTVTFSADSALSGPSAPARPSPRPRSAVGQPQEPPRVHTQDAQAQVKRDQQPLRACSSTYATPLRGCLRRPLLRLGDRGAYWPHPRRGYLRWRGGARGAWRQVGTCRGDQGSRARGVRRPAVKGVGGPGLESGFTFFLLKLTRNRMSIGS